MYLPVTDFLPVLLLATWGTVSPANAGIAEISLVAVIIAIAAIRNIEVCKTRILNVKIDLTHTFPNHEPGYFLLHGVDGTDCYPTNAFSIT